MSGLITAATAALAQALTACAEGKAHVMAGHPADQRGAGASINLFLYGVRQIAVRSTAPAQVTLGLSYLVTVYDESGDTERSRAAAEAVMRCAMAHPVLPAEGLLESSKLTPQPFADSVAQIWPLLQLPYRLSFGWDLAVTGRLEG